MPTNPFFQSKGFQRLLVMAFIVLVLFAMRSVINIILITFIITYLMDRLESNITRFASRWFRLNRKLVVIVLYALVVIGLGIGLYRYFPKIVMQISQLLKLVNEFYKHPPQESEWFGYLFNALKDVEISKYVEQGVEVLYKYVTNIGKLSFSIVISLILSLFFLLEKERIIAFTSKFKRSKVSAIYSELAYFASRFVRSFGKVIEAQFLIAAVNCVLSVIALWIMGFPQLLGLGLMIFLLGLIPVAGVIISLIPLCTIAYSLGGITLVLSVVVMIVVIHAIESYILNPNLMSSKTNLPVFYTFIVLVLSEHFLGVWGLIIGIPIFMFLLDVLGVTEDGTKQG
ncbi:AI-2E family transporter [Paenibacillus flagellatus]|uniref:AI-2E family transporter n=1 Tax=Paenibacillus flagellatus TaxID=2211139 RepID=A0A2V5K0I0_9BACL|nr:AI-2E family transporter [Paenibacillus flagellatus]PYI52638.1 AI-2E family transporter [Paenibacillus flagellatus]